MASVVADNPFDLSQSAYTPAVQTAGVKMGGGLIGQAAQYTPETAPVNRATETSAGQLDTLLAGDSPLMQRARTLSDQQMAGRGLINSSMAIESGVGAMIDRASPLALQDAQTYGRRAEFNLGARNEAAKFNAGEQNQFGLEASRQGFQSGENALERQFRTSERLGTQDFTRGENVAQREFTTSERLGGQEFTSGENNLQRQMQVKLAEFSEQGADRRQALQLTQQWAITQLQEAGVTNRFDQEQALRSRQFDIEQHNADRRLVQQQQFEMERLGYAARLQRDTLPTQFTADVARTNQASINQVLADPNLSSVPDQPDGSSPKTRAVDNIINNSNAQLDWAEQMYRTPVPRLTAPSRTPASTPAPAPAPAPAPPPAQYYYSGSGDGGGNAGGGGGD